MIVDVECGVLVVSERGERAGDGRRRCRRRCRRRHRPGWPPRPTDHQVWPPPQWLPPGGRQAALAEGWRPRPRGAAGCLRARSAGPADGAGGAPGGRGAGARGRGGAPVVWRPVEVDHHDGSGDGRVVARAPPLAGGGGDAPRVAGAGGRGEGVAEQDGTGSGEGQPPRGAGQGVRVAAEGHGAAVGADAPAATAAGTRQAGRRVVVAAWRRPAAGEAWGGTRRPDADPAARHVRPGAGRAAPAAPPPRGRAVAPGLPPPQLEQHRVGRLGAQPGARRARPAPAAPTPTAPTPHLHHRQPGGRPARAPALLPPCPHARALPQPVRLPGHAAHRQGDVREAGARLRLLRPVLPTRLPRQHAVRLRGGRRPHERRHAPAEALAPDASTAGAGAGAESAQATPQTHASEPVARQGGGRTEGRAASQSPSRPRLYAARYARRPPSVAPLRSSLSVCLMPVVVSFQLLIFEC